MPETITLGTLAPLTKAEKDFEKQQRDILEANPLFYHQCERPTKDQIPSNAKERQTYTCPDCGAQYRLKFTPGLSGEPGEALKSEKQVVWVRM